MTQGCAPTHGRCAAPRRLLVTGASGELGHAVLRALGESPDAAGTEFVVLLRASDPQALRSTAALLLRGAGVRDTRRFRAVAGDITLPHVVADTPANADLLDGLSGILHIAADTSFSKPLAAMRVTNVDGTRHVVDLARRHGGVPVGHISSLYASGGHTGMVPECRLPPPPCFVNAYEQSKWEAEELLFESDADFCIFRCGLMPGSSAGVVHRLAAFHLLAALYQQNLVGFAPGRPECPLEVMSTDDSARAVVALFLRHFEPGAVFHVGFGARAPRVDAVAERLQAAVARSRFGTGRRPVRTEFVDASLFDALRDSARATRNMKLVRALGLTQSFMPQLFYPKQFCNARAAALLPLHTFCDPLSVVDRALDYCIDTQWLFTLEAGAGSGDRVASDAARAILCYVSARLRERGVHGHMHLDRDLTPLLDADLHTDVARYAHDVAGTPAWAEWAAAGPLTGRRIDTFLGALPAGA